MAGSESDSTPERRRRLWLSAAAAPFIACVVLSFAYAYDAPYYDEWVYVTPIQHAFEGRLAPSDFVVRLNEHICLVSSLIVIPLARATHWDLRWEIAVTLLLYAGIFALMVRALAGTERAAGRRGSLWAAPVIACLLFSGSQYAVWNWGLLVSLSLAVFFIVAAIGRLGSGPLNWRRLAIAGACGWAATFSIGGGLAVWPAGVAVLLARVPRERVRAWRCLAAWMGMGGAAAGVYLSVGSAVSSDSLLRVVDPLSYALYVLAFLGGPLAAGQGGAAVVLGLALVAALGAWVRAARRRGPDIFSVAPIVVGLVSTALVAAALTGLKHAHEGADNAISSRFLPWATLAWCGLVIGVYAEHPELVRAPRRVRAAIAFGMIALLATSAFGVYKADERHDAFLLGRRALIEDIKSPDMIFLHPKPETLRELRDILIKHRLTVFRDLPGVAAHPGGELGADSRQDAR